jgi:hypothetical protein
VDSYSVSHGTIQPVHVEDGSGTELAYPCSIDLPSRPPAVEVMLVFPSSQTDPVRASHPENPDKGSGEEEHEKQVPPAYRTVAPIHSVSFSVRSPGSAVIRGPREEARARFLLRALTRRAGLAPLTPPLTVVPSKQFFPNKRVPVKDSVLSSYQGVIQTRWSSWV